MKKLIFIALILFINASFSMAQLIPISNSFQAVFKILIPENQQMGSSVRISGNDGKTVYLITCKHLFDNCKFIDKQEINIKVFYKEQWGNLKGIIHFCSNVNVDIVAIELIDQIWVENSFDITMNGIYPGLEVYFLGYPLGLDMKGSGEINNGFNLPWVKYGHVSSFFDDNSVKTIFLDGINNKGFSGGPVFTNINGKLTLIGIVSGYKFDLVADKGNSGIMYCVSSYHITELINAIK